MATEIISIRQPSIGKSMDNVLRAQAGLRMLRSYAAEHLSLDVETGPNGGMAGPDILYQCDSLISLLDAVHEDLDAVETNRRSA